MYTKKQNDVMDKLEKGQVMMLRMTVNSRFHFSVTKLISHKVVEHVYVRQCYSS